MKRILLVLTGRPPAYATARFGGSDAWFGRLLAPRVLANWLDGFVGAP